MSLKFAVFLYFSFLNFVAFREKLSQKPNSSSVNFPISRKLYLSDDTLNFVVIDNYSCQKSQVSNSTNWTILPLVDDSEEASNVVHSSAHNSILVKLTRDDLEQLEYLKLK